MNLATKLTRAAEKIELCSGLVEWGGDITFPCIPKCQLIDYEAQIILIRLYGWTAFSKNITGRHAVMALLFAAEVVRRP